MTDSTKRERMSWEDVVHNLAQGAVNITEGHTVIEPDSRVHRALIDFCEYETEKSKLASMHKRAPHNTQREILMLAGNIREVATDAVLEWGRAIGKSEAAPQDEALKKRAQEQGRAVANLAFALAKRLG